MTFIDCSQPTHPPRVEVTDICPSLIIGTYVAGTQVKKLIAVNGGNYLFLPFPFNVIGMLCMNEVKDDLAVEADFACQRVQFFHLELRGVVDHLLESIEMNTHFSGHGCYRDMLEDVLKFSDVTAFN